MEHTTIMITGNQESVRLERDLKWNTFPKLDRDKWLENFLNLISKSFMMANMYISPP